MAHSVLLVFARKDYKYSYIVNPAGFQQILLNIPGLAPKKMLYPRWNLS
jgi:hypothetical protein